MNREHCIKKQNGDTSKIVLQEQYTKSRRVKITLLLQVPVVVQEVELLLLSVM